MTESYAGAKVVQMVTSQDHWYVNFTGQANAEHNNHLVIGWVLLDTNAVVPLVTDPANSRDIVPASNVSSEYVILNPYSQCPACVRPPESGSITRMAT